MFSCWILHIFNTLRKSEIGRELLWMMHKIKDEDIVANCMQKISCNLCATTVWEMFQTTH